MARKKDRMLAAAIAAVILEEESGSSLQPAASRDQGKAWSRDHLALIHISEPTRPRLNSYAVFCLKKNNMTKHNLVTSSYRT